MIDPDAQAPARRRFLRNAASAGVGIQFGSAIAGAEPVGPGGFVDLVRGPDAVRVFTEAGDQSLKRVSEGRWQGQDLEVSTVRSGDALSVVLSAPRSAVKRVQLRWRAALPDDLRFLGDHWERGYGDLEWRGMNPDRVMPWYFLTEGGRRTSGFGVKTGTRAFCFWMADPDGISLWADTRSGGVGVQLEARRLEVCSVVCRAGAPGDTSFSVQRALCRQMCPEPRLPAQPIYGSNDWYYAYGKNTAPQILDDCRRLVELSPSGANRPYAVIDDGWQATRPDENGPWNEGNERFGSMQKLADDIRAAGARPGIWMRPLVGMKDPPASWRMRDAPVLDPSVAEVKERVAADIARLRQWGYEMIKHDYSTFDILGRWGFAFGATLTNEGWAFKAGRARTTAEVILDLYQVIRTAADKVVVLGCNTISHLTAGMCEASRIGDDTSGKAWDRTRKMGVNSLAFRAAHHGTFYAADADCLGLTPSIPWELNRRWLDLLARSGTPLFVSAQKEATGPEQQKALREAFALAARTQPLGEPLDWMHTTCPRQWRLGGEKVEYDWMDAEGCSPFPV